MFDTIRSLFSDSEDDELEKSHVCLCHQQWFDSQESLEEHLNQQRR